MSTGGPAGTADSYFAPRETPWFRARLALRVAVPLDGDARSAALKVTWSAALVAPPVTVTLVAPAATLTLGAVFGLCCAALPGAAAIAWSAARLCETRRLAARALRQAGAEQRIAWMIAAGRLSLFAGFGAFFSAAWVAALHDPLVAVLPRGSPLHAMFGDGSLQWLGAVAMTAALVTGGALLASSPLWARIDWSRFNLLKSDGRRVEQIRVRALRVWRRPG